MNTGVFQHAKEISYQLKKHKEFNDLKAKSRQVAGFHCSWNSILGTPFRPQPVFMLYYNKLLFDRKFSKPKYLKDWFQKSKCKVMLIKITLVLMESSAYVLHLFWVNDDDANVGSYLLPVDSFMKKQINVWNESDLTVINHNRSEKWEIKAAVTFYSRGKPIEHQRWTSVWSRINNRNHQQKKWWLANVEIWMNELFWPLYFHTFTGNLLV